MADKFRYQYGETHPVLIGVESATVIEIGDMAYLDAGLLKPAALLADQSSEEANQALFAQKFVGVAMQRSRAGETSPVRVATAGVFEFPCPSSSFQPGDLLGASNNADGDALRNQQVEGVLRPELAIGVAVQSVSSGTHVLLRLVSRLFGQGLEFPSRYTERTAELTDDLVLTCDDAYFQKLDPGGSGRTIYLPVEAASRGLKFVIHNTADGDETLTVQSSDATTTICGVGQNEAAVLECDGVAWRGLVGAGA